MSARIHLKNDDLDELSRKFAMTPLAKPLFINSVPKCGTHLIRNIARMFVAPHQQYKSDFIQHAILHLHGRAFGADAPLLSWGHLFFSDVAAVALRDVGHIVMVRDPYDWVLARTRFFLSDQFQGNLNNIKNNAAPIEDVLNLMIFGALEKSPQLSDIFNMNAVAWMGTRAQIVRYEDLVAHLKAIEAPAAEAFFRDLIVEKMGIPVWPADWRERILLGSDRRHSATAREHLRHDVIVPEELPAAQKRLVDYHAPGLRRILGYE
ncbi:MAG: hypothetical protein WDM79_11375 [Terricaulis sp.]